MDPESCFQRGVWSIIEKKCVLKYYAIRAGSAVQQRLSEGSHYGVKNIRLQNCRCCFFPPATPAMFTEIEFAANEEKNKMTYKESEGDNQINNSGTSQYTKSSTIWATDWFFQNFRCNRHHPAATISRLRQYRPSYFKCDCPNNYSHDLCYKKQKCQKKHVKSDTRKAYYGN